MNEASRINLLPCPFCGSEKINVGSTLDDDSEQEQWAVVCSDCGSSCSCYCDSEQVAIREWNTRAPAPTSNAIELAAAAIAREGFPKARESARDYRLRLARAALTPATEG